MTSYPIKVKTCHLKNTQLGINNFSITYHKSSCYVLQFCIYNQFERAKNKKRKKYWSKRNLQNQICVRVSMATKVLHDSWQDVIWGVGAVTQHDHQALVLGKNCNCSYYWDQKDINKYTNVSIQILQVLIDIKILVSFLSFLEMWTVMVRL